MYVDVIWLIIIFSVCMFGSYRLGFRIGHLKGYDKYDKELEAMQKKGEVRFPSLKDED